MERRSQHHVFVVAVGLPGERFGGSRYSFPPLPVPPFCPAFLSPDSFLFVTVAMGSQFVVWDTCTLERGDCT